MRRTGDESMKKLLESVQALAGRFGWGVIVSSSSYVNGLLVITAGLACFLLCLLFSMFGIQPGPPEYTSNPISWVLYFLCLSCYGWKIWSIMASYLLFPLGIALSILDMIGGRKSGSVDLYRGGVAGICMAAIPIALWFQSPNSGNMLKASITPLLFNHFH
jgi:hypothetical protein